MTSKPTEPDDAAGANSTIHDSTEPSSSAEPAAVTRSLAGAMGSVSSSPNVCGQKGAEDDAKTPRNSGKRRDKSKSVEPSEPPVDRYVVHLSRHLSSWSRMRPGAMLSPHPMDDHAKPVTHIIQSCKGVLSSKPGTDPSSPPDCSPIAS